MHKLKNQIRVTNLNSKLIEGKLYLAMSKISVLKDILYNQYIDKNFQVNHPTLGRLVYYKGPYIRTTK